MKNVKKVAAGLLSTIALGALQTAQADVVFGITGAGNLIESDSWENLMDASYHINHGKSPVGWSWGHRYFMADGHVFGVDGRNHLDELLVAKAIEFPRRQLRWCPLL